MDGAFGAAGRKRSIFINVTPLVDVMLLLVIFFAVTSTFDRNTGLPVALPKSNEASAQDAAPEERTITVLGGGQFAYGADRGLDKTGLEKSVRESVAQDPDAPILLRAEAASTYQEYIDALGVAKRAGVRHLVLQTQQVAAP